MTVLIIGVISSVIASVMYALLSFFIRPKIETSNIICVTNESDGAVYKVKVINKTHARLMNVFYTLDYCEDSGDDRSYLTEIPSRKGVVNTIEKKNGKNTDYAIRVSYLVDENKFPLTDKTRLIFTITATHPFSNTSVCKKTIYKKDDIKHNAEFQTGLSMAFLNHSKSDTAQPNKQH